MIRFLDRVLRYPIYLWLLGIFPILHLYSANFGIVRDNEAALAIVCMLIATTILFSLSARALRNPQRRALYLGILSLAFSTSGHLYEILFMPKSLLVWNLLSAAAVIALLFATHRLITQNGYAQLTAPLNLVSTLLFTLQIVTLASQMIEARGFAPLVAAYDEFESARQDYEKVTDSASRPDIYYIIPDGYPSDSWLLSAMEYDNSAFTAALEERGFAVAPNVQSNYGATLVSLASTLNMRYLTSNPSDYADFEYLRWSTANSPVARYLLQLGYTYIQFLSGFLHPSPIADINRDLSPNGPVDFDIQADVMIGRGDGGRRESTYLDSDNLLFKQPLIPLYIDTTALRLVHSQLEQLLPQSKWTPYHRFSGQRFIATIDAIESVVAMPEATFTIIHLMKPHFPVNFNEAGQSIGPIEKPSHDEYFADFRFANSQFLRLIDMILEGSANEPVIIFQADHGSVYGYATTEDRRMVYFDIYAGYYLPDSFSLDFSQAWTLVNSFPLILNEVFGADFEIHDNRLLEILDYQTPWLQQDLTNELARSP